MSRKEDKNKFSQFFKGSGNAENQTNFQEFDNSNGIRRPNIGKLRSQPSMAVSTEVQRQHTQNVCSTESPSPGVSGGINADFLRPYEYIPHHTNRPLHENRVVIHNVEVLPATTITVPTYNATNKTSNEKNIQTTPYVQQNPMMIALDDDDEFEKDLSNPLSTNAVMKASDPRPTQIPNITFEDDDIFNDEDIMRQLLSNK